ncbi:MAG: bacteriohemerythrin [Rhodocyclaceae bacterium]|jgi:hemerythrin|nr:bacteriohemerythrin [Rhodocyclaceae bacterium]
MAELVWSDDLNTGIEPIDMQHRQIVTFINQLYEAQLAGDRDATADVIDGLIEYTVSHFAFEETLMEDAGYEFVRPHKKVHELFVRRVSEFHERFKNGEDVAQSLHQLLARWLFNHIRHDDASYVDSVKASMRQLTEEKHEGGWLSRSLGRFFGRK